MASAVAWRLFSANIRKIFMLEVENPLAVRCGVSFCEAVYEGSQKVEAVEAVRARNVDEIRNAWKKKKIAVIADPQWRSLAMLRPDVTVDAILAKKNLGTNTTEAPLVVGLGPGFRAGKDVHMVIETNRGHDLGRIITSGSAEPNTGIPGSIGGHDVKRVLRAPVRGVFTALHSGGDLVKIGDVIGSVENQSITAEISGSLRGLIRSGTHVPAGLKLGDIDPRGKREYCYTISDKARAIAGSVLEAILRKYN
jgi:xanthine dehydrogenase accessory factor